MEDDFPFDAEFGNLNGLLRTGYWAFNIGSVDGMCHPFLSKRMNAEWVVESPTKKRVQDCLRFNQSCNPYIFDYINDDDEEAAKQKEAYYSSVKNNMQLINATSIETRVTHSKFQYEFVMTYSLFIQVRIRND